MLKHPVTLLGAQRAVGLAVVELWGQAPVSNR